LVLNENLQVISGSASFCKFFQMTTEAIRGQSIYQLWGGKVNSDQLRHIFEEKLKESDFHAKIKFTYRFEDGKQQELVLSACKISHAGLSGPQILLAIDPDINHRR
jgi:hypothetical protein